MPKHRNRWIIIALLLALIPLSQVAELLLTNDAFSPWPIKLLFMMTDGGILYFALIVLAVIVYLRGRPR